MAKKLFLLFVLLVSFQLYADNVPVNIQEQYNYLLERNSKITGNERNLGKWFLILKNGTVKDLKDLLVALEDNYTHLTYKSSILNLRAADATSINDYLVSLNADELLELYVAVDDVNTVVVPIAPLAGGNTEEELVKYYSSYFDGTLNNDGYDVGEIKNQIASRFEHSSELVSQYKNNLITSKKHRILLIQSIAQYKFKNHSTQTSLITKYAFSGEWEETQRNALKENIKQDVKAYSSNVAVNKLLKYSSGFYKVVYGREPNAEVPQLQFDFDIEGLPIENTVTKNEPNDTETLSAENIKVFDFAGIFTQEEYKNINEELQGLPLNGLSKVYVYYTDDSVSEEITNSINDISEQYNTAVLWFHLEANNTFSTKLILSPDVEDTYAFLKLWRSKTTFEKLAYRGKDMLRDFGAGFAEFGTVLADFIKKAKIPEDFYNKCAPTFNDNYGQVYEALNTLLTIDPVLVTFTDQVLNPFSKNLINAYTPEFCNYDVTKPADQLWVMLAFYSGVWNEVVNLVAEIPESFKIINFLINPDIDSTGEIKNFFNQISFSAIKDLAAKGFAEAFPSDNIYVISHSSGRATIFIASFAVAFTKVGKLSKLTTIVEAVDVSALLFRAIGVGTKYSLKLVGKLGSGIYHLVSNIDGKIIAKIRKLSTNAYEVAIKWGDNYLPVGKLDEDNILRVDKWLEEGEVLETLEDVKYIDDAGLEKTGNLPIVKNGDEVGGKIVKEADDIMPSNFFENVNDLASTYDQFQKLSKTLRGEIYNYYKQQKWDKLESIFKEYNLNGGWPPANGGYNIIDDIIIKAGEKYDRYQVWFKLNEQGKPIFGGSFTSPVKNGKSFSYEKRALENLENENALYYEIEILKDLPIKGQKADIIPWHGKEGKGEQMMLKFQPKGGEFTNFDDLIEKGFIKIKIKSSPNGNYKQWEGKIFEN